MGREEEPEHHLANLRPPRASFGATQALLAELPATELRAVIRFYAITRCAYPEARIVLFPTEGDVRPPVRGVVPKLL